jgi:hypothetical protein
LEEGSELVEEALVAGAEVEAVGVHEGPAEVFEGVVSVLVVFEVPGSWNRALS